jgi:translocation and assembly module TamB
LQLQQANPIDVRLSDDVVQILNCDLKGDNTQLSLTGNIYPKENTRLALQLSAEVGLDVLSKWDPSITASGPATTKVAISGTLKQPSLTGALDIRNGNFRHDSLPNSLTEIQSLITFKNRNITLQSFQALSSGGKLTAGGSAILKGYGFDTYRFDVYADKVRVQYPEGLRTTVSGELHLQKEAEASYLTGNLNILQGIYARSFEESPSVFRYARVPGFAGSSGAFDDVKLNIHIESQGNLLVRNNFANMSTSANLNLIGTINDPVMTGRVEVDKGEIIFREREYQIIRGSIDFSNPYRTEPQLNFIAETRIREYHITLTFTGTFDRIYHDINSDPPLPRDDLYALLGGYNLNQTQGVGVSNLLLDEGISRFVAAPLASPIERGFRKAFGLQRFHIDPTYVQSTQVATARITLQKDISSDFSITISTNLFTVAEEIILLQYQLTDEIRITASKDELARYGVDVLVTKTFE